MAGLSTFILVSTLLYTVGATIAVGLHFVNLREARLNQHAIRLGMPDGLGEIVAEMIVRVEVARLIKALCIASIGYGVLLGFRGIGWMLLPVPILGIIASSIDLNARHHANIIAERIIAERKQWPCPEPVYPDAPEYPATPDENAR